MSEERFDFGGKVPTFDGDAVNFPSWWKRFLAIATMSNFKDILKEERDKNLPEKEVSDEDEETYLTEQQKLAIKKNDKAMTSFSLALSLDKSIQIIYAASTKAWPKGEAYLVVKESMKQYLPLDSISKVEMCLQLSKIKMRRGMDPSILFTT